MGWIQKEIQLAAKPRGFHLITAEIAQQLPELRDFQVGLGHIFIQHTSASLALNENADPTVRQDMERHFNVLAPENAPLLCPHLRRIRRHAGAPKLGWLAFEVEMEQYLGLTIDEMSPRQSKMCII